MEINVHKQRVEMNNNKGKINKSHVKRGLWKQEEDLILKNYVEAHGEGNWALVSQRSGLGRGGKSCRLRWKNYLRSNIKRGDMSEEEEDLIIRMHKLLGNRWSLIAGRLPGRTDNEVKNYWNTHLNKKCLLGKRKTMETNNYNHSNGDDDNDKEEDDKNSSKKRAANLESRNVKGSEEDEEGSVTETWVEDTKSFNYDLGTIITPLFPTNNNNNTFFFDDDPFIAYLNSFVMFETYGWSMGEEAYSQLW